MTNSNSKDDKINMTPYTGLNPYTARRAITAMQGTRYLMEDRNCHLCIHSLFTVDRSPPSCRVNLCDLEMPKVMLDRIEKQTSFNDSILSRFYYIQNLELHNKIIDNEAYELLIKDKRILDMDDKKNCYFLTNSPGLYRIADLVYLHKYKKSSDTYISLSLKERDVVLENCLNK